MTRVSVRMWSMFLLPALAACGLTDVLAPDAGVVEQPEVREFEGSVVSVDLTARSFTFADGSVVRLFDATERVADGRGRTYELAEVHAALAVGASARAWGKGEVEQADPLILDATRNGFEIQHPVREFEGRVVFVNLTETLFEMENGATVRLAEHTSVEADASGARHELAAVHEAIEAGHRVFAWGAGELHGEEPPVLEALRVAFQIQEIHRVDFEGSVVEVDVESAMFRFLDGPLIQVTDRTRFASGDGSVDALRAMLAAVDAGLPVFAWGAGYFEGTSLIVAVELAVEIGPGDPEPEPDLVDFEGSVAYFAAGSVFLMGGVEVIVTGDTEVVPGNDRSPGSIEELNAALEAGRQVAARGIGRVESAEPLRLVADRLVLEVAVVDFENTVAFLDPFGGGFFLVDGTFVMVTDQTTLTAADPNSPSDLGGLDRAIRSGDRVRATGSGFALPASDGPVAGAGVEATDVTFLRIPR